MSGRHRAALVAVTTEATVTARRAMWVSVVAVAVSVLTLAVLLTALTIEGYL